MNVSLIDKDLFASLLRYGEVILPDYSFSVVSEDLPIEEALRLVLRAGNPIEYPSQYIIVLYESPDNSNKLPIGAVKELVATDADGRRLFSSQFREDLIIQPERYKAVFQEYLDDDFQKEKIKKGIASFRTLCGLNVTDNYDEDVNVIYHGISNRIRYRHHFQLPAEERNDPYALMISYDRHAPYPKAWAGYFYDVIETFCYHRDPNLEYSETVIEGTGIYKRISELPHDATSKQIDDAIKDEKFTQLCNEFFNKPGGYLVPYIFFILRDRFRDAESFSKHANLIQQIKKQYPEAFDTASIFVGGFFGYEKFYDDYYTTLNLPILRIRKPFRSPDSIEPVPAKAEKTSDEVDHESAEAPVEAVAHEDTNESNPEHPSQADVLDGFSDGTDLFKKLYYVIYGCLNKGAERDNILTGLSKHKNDDDALEVIHGLFISPVEKKDLIKKHLSLSRYPGKSIKIIRDTLSNKVNIYGL